MEYPKLRWPIDARMVSLGDEEVIVLECPMGLIENPLVLVRAIAPILTSFDGRLSKNDILNKFDPLGLTPQFLDDLISLLDQNLFLDNDAFIQGYKKVRDEFSSSRVRFPVFVGSTYDSNPAVLKQYLKNTLEKGGSVITAPSSTEPLACLVSPHIDYQRGAVGYAEAYREISKQEETTAILIGTSHKYSQHLFHLTVKDFDTPLGAVGCDTDFAQKLIARHGIEKGLADEFLHKKEHSLELQTPFLKYTAPDLTIVPILIGGFHEFITTGKTPSQNEEYVSFIESLTSVTKETIKSGRRVSIVAGIDMAHVGPQFGDRELTPNMMEEVHQRDQEYLSCLLNRDKDKLFHHIAEDNDKRRICGFPTMYTVLDLFERLGVAPSSQLLGYHQAVDYKTGCAVTFGALSYRGSMESGSP